MKESIGDLWDFPSEYIVIPVNGTLDNSGNLVMGAGVALQAKRKFPDLPKLLGIFLKKFGNRAFILSGHKLITYPTKEHWKDLSIKHLIVKSAYEVVGIADKFEIKSVVLPRIGCGNGQLEWSEIRKLINIILDDRFTVVSEG